MYICVYINIYTNICIYVYIYAYCVCAYTYVHTYAASTYLICCCFLCIFISSPTCASVFRIAPSRYLYFTHLHTYVCMYIPTCSHIYLCIYKVYNVYNMYHKQILFLLFFFKSYDCKRIHTQ